MIDRINNKLDKGQAKVQFIANINDINDLLIKGHNCKLIYNSLKDKNKITMSYSSFIFNYNKQFMINKLYKSKNNKIRPDTSIKTEININSKDIIANNTQFSNKKQYESLQLNQISEDDARKKQEIQELNEKMDKHFKEIELKNKLYYQSGGMTEEERDEVRNKLFGE
jgi:hypothetical protein